jgi:hypothetical protein
MLPMLRCTKWVAGVSTGQTAEVTDLAGCVCRGYPPGIRLGHFDIMIMRVIVAKKIVVSVVYKRGVVRVFL